jgi:hypothetical protein
MNATYHMMDAYKGTDAISKKDAKMFITLYDREKDKRLNKNELMPVINQTLFTLVFEDALKSEDP